MVVPLHPSCHRRPSDPPAFRDGRSRIPIWVGGDFSAGVVFYDRIQTLDNHGI